MKKAIFLDRDGTINVEKHYLYRIKDFEYIDGVIDALQILDRLGYMLIIITNQSGIARGYYTEKDFIHLSLWMLEDLKKKKINISQIYYCPHCLEGRVKEYVIKCKCRKPGTQLFWEAQKEFNISMAHSYAIGDKMRDISICQECDIQGIILEEPNNNVQLNNIENKMYKKLWRCQNLYEAAKLIAVKGYKN